MWLTQTGFLGMVLLGTQGRVSLAGICQGESVFVGGFFPLWLVEIQWLQKPVLSGISCMNLTPGRFFSTLIYTKLHFNFKSICSNSSSISTLASNTSSGFLKYPLKLHLPQVLDIHLHPCTFSLGSILRLTVSKGPHIQAIPTSCRLFQCNLPRISVWLFSILIVLSRFSYISIIARLLPYKYIHPDPAKKIVFLACCFEHASSLYPPYHQLPSSPTVLFHSFPWHHLSYTVKTSVPAPAGLPPTLSPAIACWFHFVTSTYVLFVLEEAPHSHPKCFFLTPENFLSNFFFVLTPVTSWGQESGWDMDRREHSLLYWPTLLSCLPELFFFLCLRPDFRADVMLMAWSTWTGLLCQ